MSDTLRWHDENFVEIDTYSRVVKERDEARKLAELWRDKWEDACCCSVCQGHRLPWEVEK